MNILEAEKKYYTAQVVLHTINCPTCGVTFGIPTEFKNSLKENKSAFYCPNGHKLYFNKSKEEKLAEKKINEAAEKMQELNIRLIDEQSKRKNLELQLHKFICPYCGKARKHLDNHVAKIHPENFKQWRTKEKN